MKKQYEVTLSPFYDVDLTAVWEIDFDFKDFHAEHIKNVEQAIIEMNTFWSDSPDNNTPFDEHLAYFLKHATVRMHNIYSNLTLLWRPEDLTKHLFSEIEGFCIGECGIKLIDFIDNFELTESALEIEECNN